MTCDPERWFICAIRATTSRGSACGATRTATAHRLSPGCTVTVRACWTPADDAAWLATWPVAEKPTTIRPRTPATTASRPRRVNRTPPRPEFIWTELIRIVVAAMIASAGLRRALRAAIFRTSVRSNACTKLYHAAATKTRHVRTDV